MGWRKRRRVKMKALQEGFNNIFAKNYQLKQQCLSVSWEPLRNNLSLHNYFVTAPHAALRSMLPALGSIHHAADINSCTHEKILGRHPVDIGNLFGW